VRCAGDRGRDRARSRPACATPACRTRSRSCRPGARVTRPTCRAISSICTTSKCPRCVPCSSPPGEHVAYLWLPIEAANRKGRLVDESRSVANASKTRSRLDHGHHGPRPVDARGGDDRPAAPLRRGTASRCSDSVIPPSISRSKRTRKRSRTSSSACPATPCISCSQSGNHYSRDAGWTERIPARLGRVVTLGAPLRGSHIGSTRSAAARR